MFHFLYTCIDAIVIIAMKREYAIFFFFISPSIIENEDKKLTKKVEVYWVCVKKKERKKEEEENNGKINGVNKSIPKTRSDQWNDLVRNRNYLLHFLCVIHFQFFVCLFFFSVAFLISKICYTKNKIALNKKSYRIVFQKRKQARLPDWMSYVVTVWWQWSIVFPFAKWITK